MVSMIAERFAMIDWFGPGYEYIGLGGITLKCFGNERTALCTGLIDG